MIQSLKSLLSQALLAQREEPSAREHALELATAALMLEVARADFTQEGEEEQRITSLMREQFELSDEEVAVLLDEAGGEVDEAVSLYGFTRLINDNLAPEEKGEVIRLMWEVAYADGELHHYEDHLIRKVAELIYVPTPLVLKLKHQAQLSAGA